MDRRLHLGPLQPTVFPPSSLLRGVRDTDLSLPGRDPLGSGSTSETESYKRTLGRVVPTVDSDSDGTVRGRCGPRDTTLTTPVNAPPDVQTRRLQYGEFLLGLLI